jgi:hypothetical protein
MKPDQHDHALVAHTYYDIGNKTVKKDNWSWFG